MYRFTCRFYESLGSRCQNYGQQDWLSDVTSDSAQLSPKGSVVLAELIYNKV